jgi:RNA polymerase sigma-70 factor (sigma-E family)
MRVIGVAGRDHLARRADSAPGPQAAGTRPAPTAAELDHVVGQLYQAHAVTLVRMANLLIRDRTGAEDIVQDAFIGLYRALPRLRDHDQLLPYLRTAVINGSRSALRQRRRTALRVLPHEAAESSAESAVLLSEERRAVFAAMGRLPRRSREVLVLRYYLDLPDHQIAATLGVSRGTVSSTASRAVAALARELKEDL